MPSQNTKLDRNYEYDFVEVDIAAADTEYDIANGTKIDADMGYIHGIALVVTDEDALPDSRCKLTIDGQEIFPKNFPAVKLYAGKNVAPNNKFLMLNRPIKTNQALVEGSYTDGDALGSFAAYKAIFVFLCEPKSKQSDLKEVSSEDHKPE